MKNTPASNNNQTALMGYARKSKAGGAVRLSLAADSLKKAKKVEGKDGKKYLNMIINVEKLNGVMNGEREFAPVVQFKDDEQKPAE